MKIPEKYPKILTIFERTLEDGPLKGKVLVGRYRAPWIEYLKDTPWFITEKIDGTNIRIGWDHATEAITILPRKSEDFSHIHKPLREYLSETFTAARLKRVFPEHDITLYGEGCGAGIQKHGAKYMADGTGVKFVLFDIQYPNGSHANFLKVAELGQQLDIEVVPAFVTGTLGFAVQIVREGYESFYGKFPAEGVVCRPFQELRTNFGERVIVKIKRKDFPRPYKPPETV